MQRDLELCQHPAWAPLFPRHTLRSITVPLPRAFLSYLVADGVFLPETSAALPRRGEAAVHDDRLESAAWSTSTQTQADDTDPNGSTQPVPSAADRNGTMNGDVHRGSSNYVASPAPALQEPLRHTGSSSTTSSSSASSSWDESQDWATLYPEFHASVVAAIEALGGRVVPKLNWSCPKDATWVNPLASLSCSNADEVVLMLKSSDRVAHDVTLLQRSRPQPQICTAGLLRVAEVYGSSQSSGNANIFASSSSPAAPATTNSAGSSSTGGSPAAGTPAAPLPALVPVLVLKRWYDLRPEREFRCFVKNRSLVGISQRDMTQHFPQLSDQLGVLRAALERFHEENIRGVFTLHDYSYDVYVASGGAVKILDFNPIGGTTSALLFEWSELGLEAVAASADSEVGTTDAPEAAAMGLRGAPPDLGPPLSMSMHARLLDGSAADALAGVAHLRPRNIGEAAARAQHSADAGNNNEDEGTSIKGEGSREDSSSYDSSSEGGSEVALAPAGCVQIRVVDATAAMRLGEGMAFAMPFDMLMLQDGSIDAAIEQMRCRS